MGTLPTYAPFVDLMPLKNGSFLLSTLTHKYSGVIDFTVMLIDPSQADNIMQNAPQKFSYNSTDFEMTYTTNVSYSLIKYFSCYQHEENTFIIIRIDERQWLLEPDIELIQSKYKMFKFKNGKLTKSDHLDFVNNATDPHIDGWPINTVVTSNGASYTLFTDGSILKYTENIGWQLYRSNIHDNLSGLKLVDLNNRLKLFFVEEVHQFDKFSYEYEYNTYYQMKHADLTLKQEEFKLINIKKIDTIEEPWLIFTPVVDMTTQRETIWGTIATAYYWGDISQNRFYKHTIEFSIVLFLESIPYMLIFFGLFIAFNKLNNEKGATQAKEKRRSS